MTRPVNYSGTVTRELAMEQAKSYVDPRTYTVSFSGADYKAIVFMPVDKSWIADQITQIKAQITDVVKELNEISSLYIEFHNRLIAQNDAADDAWYWYKEYELTDPVLAQYYLEFYTRAVTQRSKLINDMTISGVTSNALAVRRNALYGLDAQLNQLSKTQNNRQKATRAIELSDAQTISLSVHREKFPARTFGHTYTRGYTRAGRTIAGSLVFTVFHQHALYELLKAFRSVSNTGVQGSDAHWAEYSTAIVDQLPPFDITIIGSNELGDSSAMVLYGVEIVNEGQTMSIQDMITENVMQFVARDFDPLRPVNEIRQLVEPPPGRQKGKTASDVLQGSKYRQLARQNPFI